MKATLVINSRGVVTLPAKLRRALGLNAEDVLIAETTPDGLLSRPAVTLPIEVYTDKRIAEFDEAEADLAKALAFKNKSRRRASRMRIFLFPRRTRDGRRCGNPLSAVARGGLGYRRREDDGPAEASALSFNEGSPAQVASRMANDARAAQYRSSFASSSFTSTAVSGKYPE